MEEQKFIGLGRRAVACKLWRWLPGMRDMNGLLCITDTSMVSPQHVRQGRFDIEDDAVPDLRDPCTRGGLLELVRDAWGDPALNIVEDWRTGSPVWRAHSGRRGLHHVACDTEAEALVAALEAAPPQSR